MGLALQLTGTLDRRSASGISSEAILCSTAAGVATMSNATETQNSSGSVLTEIRTK
jgi:hypothetical protein